MKCEEELAQWTCAKGQRGDDHGAPAVGAVGRLGGVPVDGFVGVASRTEIGPGLETAVVELGAVLRHAQHIAET